MKMKPRFSNYMIAVIITLVTALMTVMTSATKIALPSDVTTLEVLVYMNVVTACFFFIYVIIRRTPFVFSQKPWIWLRAAMGFVGVFLFFFAYEKGLSLSAGIVLTCLVPIFSVIGMILFMKEKIIGIQRKLLPMILLGAVIGVVFIANPFQSTAGSSMIGVLLGVASGTLSGFTVVVIRKLMVNNKPELIGLFNAVFVVVVGFAILLITGQFRVLSLEAYLWLIVLGLFNAFAVFGMALATVFASPTQTAPYSYVSVILAPIVQFIWFGSIVTANVIAGGLLIVGVNLINFYINIRYRYTLASKER